MTQQKYHRLVAENTHAPKQTKPVKNSRPGLDLDFIGMLPSAKAGANVRAIDRIIQDRDPHESNTHPHDEVPTGIIHPAIIRNDSPAAEGAKGFEVGSVFNAPIAILVEDPLNAREFYTIEDLDEMGQSLEMNGQLAPISAYEKEGRLWVFDGVKRLKAARSAGLGYLRVDVRKSPGGDLEIYMTSRRMNLERSTQSSLDDAVRWQELLDRKIVPSQQELAKLIARSESFVSQVLAINRIPRTVLTYMKERTKTSEQVVAYKLSCIFRQDVIEKYGEEGLSRITKSIIEEIAGKDLNRQEIDRLIERRLDAPKQRARAEQQKFKFLGREGVLKTFPSNGKIEFTVSGLTPEQMAQVESILRNLPQNSA